MNQLADGQPAHNSLLSQVDIDPTTAVVAENAIEQLRALQTEGQSPVAPNTYRDDQEILDWNSPFLISKGFIRKYDATGDIEDLAKAQEFARVLKDTRKDHVGKKWQALLGVEETMKTRFGVVDALDVEKLRTVAGKLGTQEVDGRTGKVMPWGEQWIKAARYVQLAVLTETSEDEEIAHREVQTLIDELKINKGGRTVGQVPFSVDALYRLGRVEEARQLVADYMVTDGCQSHYIVEPIMAAAKETQDPAELELALSVINQTLSGYEDGHSKGLRTKYGTQLSAIASRLGDVEVAQKAAEIISNPKTREQVLGQLAVSTPQQ